MYLRFCISRYPVNSFLFVCLFASAFTPLYGQLPTTFQKVELASGLKNAINFEFAPDGRIFILDRHGEILLYKPDIQTISSAATLDVFHDMEDGLLAIAFDPDFMANQYIYLHYSDPVLPVNRVSRFTMAGDKVDLTSEVRVIEWTSDRNGYYHSAGDMDFDSKGNLYIAIGDNSNHTAYAALNEGDKNQSAERSSSNTNDLRGKILRIKPQPDGTYTIPEGNLFSGGEGGRPEIYVMGARNPFKIFVDKENTDWLFWGEVGPDANLPGVQGPEGLDEINLVKTAGNYGWPYISGKNEPYLNTYANPQFYYDHSQPVNISKWNTGAVNLPPAQPAWLDFFHGCYLAGPRYYFNTEITNPRKLPSDFHQAFFYYDFNTSNVWVVKMGASGNIQSNQRFAENVITGSGFIDLKLGPDGQLYILEYGAGCCPANVGSGKLVRIDYTGIDTNKSPEVSISADKVSGPLPLTVLFSSEGTSDADGTALTYEWDFESDGIVDSNDPNPSFTYTTTGIFYALLRVTDDDGAMVSKSLAVYPGNTSANIIFNYPPAGGMFSWEDNVDFDVTVNDAEDGSTSDGSIPCTDVNFVPSFGHLNHSHDGLTINACSGSILLDPTGHDAQGQDNIYYGFNVSYTDRDGLATYDHINIFPKLMEAEFYNGQNNTVVVANTDPFGGGVSSVRALSDNAYIMLSGRNLANIDSVLFRVSSTVGCYVEVRADSVSGLLLSTVAIPATGNPNRWTNAAAPINNPGGKHDLYFVFKKPGAINFVDLNYIDFRGGGVSTDITPPHIYAIKVISRYEVSIRFNESLDPVTANNVSNYLIDNGVAIASVALKEDKKTVILSTSPMTIGALNTLTIANLRNISGVPINENIVTTFTVENALLRVNAGGPLVVIADEAWQASNFNSGGSSLSRPNLAIANTTADAIYQTELNGNFTMNLPVGPPGVFNVNLHFAELVYKNIGERVFNVTIENGQHTLTNYDIFKKVGFAAAVTESFENVKVDDGFLNITFTGVSNKAKVSAIEVLYGDDSILIPSVRIQNPADRLQVTQPFQMNFKVKNWWVGAGSSHVRVIVDGATKQELYNTNPVSFTDLSQGLHSIKLILITAGGDTTAYSHTVNVNVVDGSACYENPFPLSWEQFVIGADLPYRSPFITAVDLNRDGFKDIVTGGWWFLNPGLPKGTWIRNLIGSPVNNSFLVYDFDNDGDPDILGTHGTYLSSQLAWAENDGHGNFIIRTNIPPEAGFPPGSTNDKTFLASCAVGNFDNVANIQIALVWNGSESTKAPVKMLTVPANPASEPWTVYDAAPNAVGEDIVPFDIDGDGDLDLSQAKNWLRNNGGSWTTISTGITLPTYYEHHWIGDLNRDGNLDGVVTQIGENQEIASFNIPANPTELWPKATLGTDVDSGLSLDVADLDFDGDLDVIAAEWKSDKRLIAFENDLCSSGTWIKHILHPGGTSAPDHHNGAQTADIDNDGDLDIISVGWDKRTPRIYFNNSSTDGENTPPVVANSIVDQSASPGVTFQFTFPVNTFADPDGDALSYTAKLADGSNLPSWLTFQGAQRTFQGTPPIGSTTMNIAVTAWDNRGGNVSDEFAIMFSNLPPVLENPIQDQTAFAGELFGFTFAANTFVDPNGDPLTYTAMLSDGAPLPIWLTFDAATRTFEGAPLLDDLGTYEIRVTASDSEGSASDIFSLAVVDPLANQPPVVNEPVSDLNASAGIAFSFTFSDNTFSDPNGDTLTYSATLSDGSALPAWLAFTSDTRTFSGTPQSGDAGTIEIALSASDGTEVVTLLFRITVESAPSIRINSGGNAVSAYGVTFSADQYAVGGSTYTNNNITDITGTIYDEMYRSERYGSSLAYQIPLASGTYLLRLHFAEIYFGATGGGSGGVGSRVFDVAAEGVPILTGFDIFAAVGSMAAVIKDFEIAVSDGMLNLSFIKIVQNPKVSGIEVIPLATASNQSPVVASPIPDQTATEGTPFTFTFSTGTFTDADNDVLSYTARLLNGNSLPAWLTFSSDTRTFSGTPTASGALEIEVTALDGKGGSATDVFVLQIEAQDTGFSPIRINSGGPGLTTPGGLTFSADNSYVGGSVYTNKNVTEVAGTVDDVIYQSERYKMSGYAIPLSSGTYTVRLHFAEIYFGAPGGGVGGAGKRVFDVALEGAVVLSRLDIYAEVGAVTALVKEHEVYVSDGVLNIDFIKVVENPKISAIEVLQSSSSARQAGTSVAQSPVSGEDTMAEDTSGEFYAWPNPFKTVTTLEYRPATSGTISMELIDAFGRVIKEVYTGAVEGGALYRYELDASGLPAGIYFGRVTRTRRTLFVKLALTR